MGEGNNDQNIFYEKIFQLKMTFQKNCLQRKPTLCEETALNLQRYKTIEVVGKGCAERLVSRNAKVDALDLFPKHFEEQTTRMKLSSEYGAFRHFFFLTYFLKVNFGIETHH